LETANVVAIRLIEIDGIQALEKRCRLGDL
jgi:hypothetical protein